VIDFGVAGLFAELGDKMNYCPVANGTPAYAAPEILDMIEDRAGEHACYRGPPQDIWSLGVVLYELAMKRKPFYKPGSQWKPLEFPEKIDHGILLLI
jgi:serine/threonine protein kinase